MLSAVLDDGAWRERLRNISATVQAREERSGIGAATVEEMLADAPSIES